MYHTRICLVNILASRFGMPSTKKEICCSTKKPVTMRWSGGCSAVHAPKRPPTPSSKPLSPPSDPATNHNCLSNPPNCGSFTHSPDSVVSPSGPRDWDRGRIDMPGLAGPICGGGGLASYRPSSLFVNKIMQLVGVWVSRVVRRSNMESRYSRPRSSNYLPTFRLRCRSKVICTAHSGASLIMYRGLTEGSVHIQTPTGRVTG
ncbi:hypothetical protein BKA67DRAFT_192790 [Truncatella angustata]|uniref:Uncharacterized protein n=1 Tax=Truncatella angustata TaxID=152316 RepID=A0A9P9A244_9PEZI|nr:uncharacterized protein BKA67DRAFT_192790 [Truncatella angustata]KAH6657590.1 hypothetical protein BKA67DRAFT_192790 [Truncatella angustata]